MQNLGYVSPETYEDVMEGVGYLYGSLGYDVEADPELGFSIRKIGRGISKAAKGAAKGAASAAKTVGKLALTPVQLIANLSLALLMKAALPLAKAVCSMPPHVLQVAVTAAGQRTDLVPIFCQAVKVKNWNGVRKMLPGIIKIAIKASAVATVPGLAPALVIIKTIPGLKNFAGAGIYSDLNPITLLDAADYVTMLGATEMLEDDEIAEGLGMSPNASRGAVIAVSLVAAAAGVGLAMSSKKRR